MKNGITYKEWKKQALNLAKEFGWDKKKIKNVLSEESMKLSWELNENFDTLHMQNIEDEMLKKMGR